METFPQIRQLARTHGSLLLTLGVLVFALIATILMTLIRHSDHAKTVQHTADSVSKAVAKEIENVLAEKQHLVQLFATDNKHLLADIARQPGDGMRVLVLSSKIDAYFPDHFTMTITDNAGTPVLEDYDGYIGQLCLNNIRDYVKEFKYEIRIHPNVEGYHVDVMADWEHEGASGVLLISFLADRFAKILKLSQPEGYKLLLVSEDESRLVEIDANGSRDKMEVKEDYRLDESLKQRILASIPVQGTAWDLIAIFEPQAQRQYNYKLLRQGATVFSVFSLVVIIMWYFFRREELQRAEAEYKLQQSHANITHLNAELETKQAQLDRESDLAMHVFDKITTLHRSEQALVESHLVSMSKFSGDMLFTNSTPSGRHYVMLCDFTGHGLPAALGAIPASEIFYEMTSEEATIGAIAEQINRKILALLPTEYFCCAILLSFDNSTNTLRVINSGLPDGLLLGADNRIKQRIRSNCLPLGITSRFARSECVKEYDYLPQDYLCIYTDGIIEARNAQGVMFGEQGLVDSFSDVPDGTPIISHLVGKYSRFVADLPQSDDVSIVKINLGNGAGEENRTPVVSLGS